MKTKKYTREQALDILIQTIKVNKTEDIVPIINEHIKNKQKQIWNNSNKN